MGVHGRKMALLCAFLLSLLLLPACSLSRDYHLSAYQQTAQVLPDGSLLVDEQATYVFDDESDGLTRQLTAPEGQSIEIESVSWQPANGNATALSASQPAQAEEGTYTLSGQADDLTLTIHQPQAGAAQGTLQVRYTIRTPAERYSDISTIVWAPLGTKGLPNAVDNVALRLVLSVSQAGQVHAAMLQGPGGYNLYAGEGGLQLDYASMPAGDEVLLRVDFPEVLLSHQAARPEALLTIRSQQQLEALHQLSLGLSWCVACWVLGIALTIYCYHKFDKDPQNVSAPPSSRMMGVTGPAELSNLMPFSTGAGAHDFSAMLLHLIHRNHLRLYPPRQGLSLNAETIGMARIERLPAPRDTLMDAEYFLIHYLVDVLGDGKSVALSDIRDAKKSEFKKDFRAWRKLVDRQLAGRPWFVRQDSQRIILALLGSILVLGSAFVALVLRAPMAWAGLPPGLWLMCYAFLMRKRTPEAMYEIQIWQTFGRKLEMSGLGRVDSIAQWERILLYAEAMQMGDLAARELAQRVTFGMTFPDAGQATFLAWGLLDYPMQLAEWFDLLTDAIRPKA